MPFGYLDAIPIAASVFGGFDAARRAKNAAREREKLLTDYQGLINQDYSNSVGNTQQNVLSQTGLLGDALRTYGSNAGAANANAGIYNSSATAGNIARLGQTGQQTLADMAMRGKQSSDAILSSGRKFLLGQRLGIADNNYNDARENLGGAQGGLMSGLGALTQRLYQENAGKAPGGGRSSVLDPSLQRQIDGEFPSTPGMGSASYGSGNLGNSTSIGMPGGFSGYSGFRSPSLFGGSPKLLNRNAFPSFGGY